MDTAPREIERATGTCRVGVRVREILFKENIERRKVRDFFPYLPRERGLEIAPFSRKWYASIGEKKMKNDTRKLPKMKNGTEKDTFRNTRDFENVVLQWTDASVRRFGE